VGFFVQVAGDLPDIQAGSAQSCLANYKQLAYTSMKATFYESTGFAASLGQYLDDEDYRQLQHALVINPGLGPVMPRTGGFRKLRWIDSRRHKGKRGGLRVIYYWLLQDDQFWMVAIYDKDELSSLTNDQESQLRQAIETELKHRGIQ